MANRMKEDEKNEKIIRGLLKLQSNRRCINCNSLGPQYVCTNFWTFVCTTCSGIHREFTHRIKSVSMAKFSSQEVSALQGGGNERAREIYFKEWDPQRHSVPDSSNVQRLRDFIKHVYVDGRYTGEKSIDKPPRVKMGDKEDSYENRRVDTYRGSSRSPPYADTYDRRHSERSGLGMQNDDKNYRYNYNERRSPGYNQETRSSDYKKSPVRFEVVNDWHRDDRCGNGRRFEERRFSEGESKLEGRSPNHQEDLDTSSPPMIRPVRDILGEGVPQLRVDELPKANGVKVSEGSARSQRTASSSSMGSIDGGSVELKNANSGSLIDFNADPEPSDAAAISPAQPTTVPMLQSVTQLTTSPSVNGDNWASFDFAPQPPTQTQAPSNANTLEVLLSQLSTPASAPVGIMPMLPVSGGAPTTAPVSNLAVLPITSAVPATTVGNVSALPFSGGVAITPALPFNDERQWTSMPQHQPSIFAATDSRSTASQFTTSVSEAPNNKPWNVQGPLTIAGQPSPAAPKPTHETNDGFPEAKNSGRQELPEDLFAATFSTVPAPVPVPGWHTGPSHGTGFGMQYPSAASVPPFHNTPKSTNPFDLNHEPALVHAPVFPNMTSLQGALPNMAASPGLLHTSSLGIHSSQWMPPQPPSYASATPPSVYMGQQVPSNVPSFGHQGNGGFGGEAAFFGTLSTDQLPVNRYSQPSNQNPFSSLGATLPGHF